MLLLYGGEQELVVKGYSDASFKIHRDDSNSQYGWVFILNYGTVTWRSSKQQMLVDSTFISEYIAASESSMEANWICNFIGDLGVVLSNKDPWEIFSDKEGVVILTKESRD